MAVRNCIVQFDLLCSRSNGTPTFTVTNDKGVIYENSPFYRIYIDNEMLTERNYRWNNRAIMAGLPEEFVREHCNVNLTSGMHTLKVEFFPANELTTEIRNFRINEKSTTLSNGNFIIE